MPCFVKFANSFIQYFTKGAASLCGVVELINEEFTDEAIMKEVEDRLMPRTEELPLYTTHEFNDKVRDVVCVLHQLCSRCFFSGVSELSSSIVVSGGVAVNVKSR